METTLNFTKKGEIWEASYISSGNTVIQLERGKPGEVKIFANLGGMKRVEVNRYENFYNSVTIFNIDMPKGVEVTVTSATEVNEAKILTE